MPLILSGSSSSSPFGSRQCEPDPLLPVASPWSTSATQRTWPVGQSRRRSASWRGCELTVPARNGLWARRPARQLKTGSCPSGSVHQGAKSTHCRPLAAAMRIRGAVVDRTCWLSPHFAIDAGQFLLGEDGIGAGLGSPDREHLAKPKDVRNIMPPCSDVWGRDSAATLAPLASGRDFNQELHETLPSLLRSRLCPDLRCSQSLVCATSTAQIDEIGNRIHCRRLRIDVDVPQSWQHLNRNMRRQWRQQRRIGIGDK